MEIYYELLKENGICDDRLIAEKDNEECRGEKACISEYDSDHPLVVDYAFSQQSVFQKIHRYSRKERFRYTLYNLLNIRGGSISSQLQNFVSLNLKKLKVSKSKVWNQVRGILKKFGYQKHYKHITNFIRFSTGLHVHVPQGAIQKCINDFDSMDDMFDRKLGFDWKRTYFLNLQFVAHKLAVKNGIVFPFVVSTVRTSRRRQNLNLLFDRFFV